MSITTKFLLLFFCLLFLETFGSPAGRVKSKPKCYPGSKIEDCIAKCPANDHLCNINTAFPDIDVVEVQPAPSGPNSPSVSASSTTTERTTTQTTTKKPEVTLPDEILDSPCPPYPILQPSGSKNPNCRIPISQYGCKPTSQDPWCRFFTFMYLFGTKNG